MHAKTVYPGRPKYSELAASLRQQIETGELRPGDRVPSYAEVRMHYGVSQSTIDKAHALLEREGLIIREQGRGTFVAQLIDIEQRNGHSHLGRLHVERAPEGQRIATKILACAGMVDSEANAYEARILAGVQDAARSEGYDLLIFRDPRSARWEMVDGLLAIGYGGMEPAFMRPAPLPCVAMLWHTDKVPYVTVDEKGAVRTLVEYLLELGHRRIGYLFAGEEANNNGRVQCYWQTLDEAGIEPQVAWLRWATPDKPYDPSVGFAGYGYREMARWLNEDWNSLGCTALLAHNDEFAIGALRALEEAGLQVPGDVSVAGFDGTQLARHSRPSLTTMEVPLYEIGATGVKLLARSLQEEHGAHSQVLAARLKVGGSTSMPR